MFRALCYGGTLIYVLGIIAIQVLAVSGKSSLFTNDYALNLNPTFFEQNKMLVLVIPLLVLIAFLPSNVSALLLHQSNFFGGVDSRYTSGYSFGMVIFENGERKITF